MTVSQDFAFYLSEKNEPDPHKRKKQVQRFNRAEGSVLAVTRRDIPLPRVTRAQARKVRDNYLASGIKVSSVGRNIPDMKTVFNFVFREHDLNTDNRFSGLELPKTDDAAIDLCVDQFRAAIVHREVV